MTSRDVSAQWKQIGPIHGPESAPTRSTRTFLRSSRLWSAGTAVRAETGAYDRTRAAAGAAGPSRAATRTAPSGAESVSFGMETSGGQTSNSGRFPRKWPVENRSFVRRQSAPAARVAGKYVGSFVASSIVVA